MQSAMLENDMRGCTEGRSGFVEVTKFIGCEGLGVPVKKIGSFRAFFWWHSNHHGEEHVCHWLTIWHGRAQNRLEALPQVVLSLRPHREH